MSLIRQLWLAVVVVMALAFGGTFLISTLAARQYFEQQLFVKNVDNATVLALSMSQMEHKDQVTVELLIAAQFDAGHYRLIRLTNPDGKVIVERANNKPVAGVPEWFVQLIPLKVAPGVAQVQDGWKQYGTLTMESHDQFAYEELWNDTLRLLALFAGVALGVGIIGSALLRWILRPLRSVVDQAEAIGERRFITQKVPRTLEFRQLVESMNRLSGRVQQMLEDESRRVEKLRHQAQVDPVTGLSNREMFMASLEDALSRDDIAGSGVLVILRLTGLADLNRAIGREAADQVLHRVGERLSHAATGHAADWVVARLNSADFAVLAYGEPHARNVAQTLASQARLALELPDTEELADMLAGCTSYDRGDTRAAVLARVDGAVAEAEQTGVAIVRAERPTEANTLPSDLATWRKTLEAAMDEQGVQLGRYPVISAAGLPMHEESPVRLRIGDEWLPAARFIAWVARLGIMPRLDMLVIDAALARISEETVPVAVNVSPETICDPSFVPQMTRRLRQSPERAAMLWLEIPEYGALRHLHEFRLVCRALKPLGCKLGLKHAGQQFARISELHDLGLDYLKIDGAIVQRVREGAGHQMFLRSLCTVAHTIGLLTIASGVGNADDMPALADLGIDGFTGPGVNPA